MDLEPKPFGAVHQTQMPAAFEPLTTPEYTRPDALTLYLRDAGKVPLLTARR